MSFQEGVDPFDVLSSIPISRNSGENYANILDGEPVSNTAVLRDIEAEELRDLLEDPAVLYIEPVSMALVDTTKALTFPR